jgi:hypothetical protein
VTAAPRSCLLPPGPSPASAWTAAAEALSLEVAARRKLADASTGRGNPQPLEGERVARHEQALGALSALAAAILAAPPELAATEAEGDAAYVRQVLRRLAAHDVPADEEERIADHLHERAGWVERKARRAAETPVEAA